MELKLTYNSLVNSALLKLGTKEGFSVEVMEKNEELANQLLEMISDTVTVRVTALKTIQERGSISCLGVTIAKASGRDSGAFIPNSVCKISGKTSSGGSVKNWLTIISEGSVFEYNVPRFIFEKFRDRYSNFNIELAKKLSIDDLI